MLCPEYMIKISNINSINIYAYHIFLCPFFNPITEPSKTGIFAWLLQS